MTAFFQDIKKIEKQLLFDINKFYIGDNKEIYQKDLNEYLKHIIEIRNEDRQDFCKKYVKAMREYIFTKKNDRDKKKLRETFGLKEKTDTDEAEAFEKLKVKTNNFNITEKNYLKESSVNAKDDVAFASGGQFRIIIQDEKGKTTTGVVTVKGASSKDGDNDNHLYKKLRDRSTTWNCSFKVSGTNNHNMSMSQTKVSTKLDNVIVTAKRLDEDGVKDRGKTVTRASYFIMNFGITFYHSQHYKYSGYSKNTDLQETRFNLEEYRAKSDGPSTVDKTSISHTGTVKDTINVQINTAKFGIRSYSAKDGTIKRYFNPSYTIKFKKPTHKVIYKYGYNDKVYKSYDITDGDKITADTTPPQNPTRTGYIFAGWSGDRTSIVCADRTLTATWTPCTHNVAYDTNGGTYDDTVNGNDNHYKIIKNGEYAIKSKMAGGRYIHAIHAGMDNGVLPCIYPKADWDQSIWVFERYGNTPYYYIINKKSGKVLSSKGSDDYVVHQWSQPLNNNSLWYLKEGDNGAVYICNKKSNLVLDVSNKKDDDNATIGLYDQKTSDNLNQQWELECREQKDYPTRTKATGSNLYVNFVTPKKEGYTFLGWTLTKDGSGNSPLYKPGAQYTHEQTSGTVNLYAQWVKSGTTIDWTHIVHYDKNATVENDDGTTTEDNVDNMPEDQTKEYGKDLILSSNIPVRKGWTFQRWSTNPDPDGGGQSYNPSETYTNDQNGGVVTLYAIWKKDPIKHTIVYDTQGGYNPQAEISGEYMISANGKNLTQNGDDVSLTTDTSDQSKWIIERRSYKISATDTNIYYGYVITNKATGKALSITENMVSADSPDKAVLWDIHKQSDGTIQIEYIDKKWAVDWNADNYLYCDAGTWYGSFTLTGDQKDYPSRTKSENENIYINNIAPERKGYKFVQWSTDPQGKNSISDNADDDDEEDNIDNSAYQPGDVYDHDQDGGTVTLYAVWEKTSFDLSIDPNGGTYNGSTDAQTTTLDPGTAFSVGLPTKDKNNFAGWDVDASEDSFPTDFASESYTNKHKDASGTFKAEDVATDDDSIGQKFTWSNIDNHQTGVNKIQYGVFAAKSGHKYQISGKVTENTGASKLVLNAVNTNGTTDYGSTTIRVTSGGSSTFSFDTSFTNDANPYLELRTEDVSTMTGDLAFTVEDLKIIDVTTGKQVYATNINGNMGASDVTFTANWNPWKHQVVYDANANNDTSVKDIPEAQTKTSDEDLTLSDNIPTRTGYTFLKWSLSKDGKDATDYAPGAVYQHDQDGGTVTLYAIWTPNTHIVHYDKNVPASSKSQTVEAMPVDQTKTFGQVLTLSILHPTRKGYTFGGWSLSADGNSNYQPGDLYTADQNGGKVTLYAVWKPWKSTIKYDKNVSSTSSSQTVTGMSTDETKTYEVDLSLNKTKPARNGYIFNGWAENKDGSGNVYQPGDLFTKDLDSAGASITLYAKWTPWKHTVHFDKNVPASSKSQTVNNMPSDVTKTFDQELTLDSTKPTRKGYSFMGWSTKADGTETTYGCGDEYTHDQNGGTVTLYAVWTPGARLINYDKNVSANDPDETKDVSGMPDRGLFKVYERDTTVSANTPTRIGYRFTGWSTKANGTDKESKVYQPGVVYSDDDDNVDTLYAQWTPWKHTVTYDKNVPSNSGSQTVSNMPADQTKIFDQSLTLSSNVPTRKGYTFAGWSPYPDGTGETYKAGGTYTNNWDINQDLVEDYVKDGGKVTLYAVWTPWKHTVKYDSNIPSSSKKTNVANMPANDTKTYETTLTLSSKVPTRTGYTFDHWSTTPNDDPNGRSYKAGSGYNYDMDTDKGTVTLYAIWTPWKYTVTYNEGEIGKDSASKSVTNMPASQVKTEEIDLTLSSTKPVRNGYIFSGWKLEDNSTTYQSGSKLSYDPDKQGTTITLKAQWTPWQHTVHFDANGGSNAPDDMTKTFDEEKKIPTDVPTKHGYNFVKWTTGKDGSGRSYTAGQVYNYDQNGGTVTLYAQWTPWKHTVHYDANGGDQSTVPADQTKTFDQNMNVATKIPTKSEYKFLGWTTKADGTGTMYQPGDAYNHDQNGGTATLYAKWVQLYTVKYDGNASTIKGSTVTGSVASQTQGQDESVNLQNNNFKNNSGIYKNWSVGKNAYLYAKRTNNPEIRKFIHEEGYQTDHETMRTEKDKYDMIEDSLTQY